jgi:hypothetical protein
VWWNEVAEKIDGFPSSSDVFHIHPIVLVGNFLVSASALTISGSYLGERLEPT